MPFFKTNIFAIIHSVPDFSPHTKSIREQILIWDNSLQVVNKTIESLEKVLNIHFTKRWLISVQSTKVHAYRISKEYERHIIFEQREFFDSRVSQIADEDDIFGILLLNNRTGEFKRSGQCSDGGRGDKGIRD